MELRQLKTLVEAGRYKPDPALVAEAMLSRRGVAKLLLGEGSTPLNPAGRSHSDREARRQAA